MSDKQRKKNERRQKRLEKRKRHQVARETKLQAVTCPNCGDRYGYADEPDVIHRAGPCDCTSKLREDMEVFLATRGDMYKISPDGRIACPTCSTMHGIDDQMVCFWEGRLVWDGCDRCFEAQAEKFESIREDHRERWFGFRKPPAPKTTTIATKPISDGKYVPSRRDTISDSTQIYQGAVIDPLRKSR